MSAHSLSRKSQSSLRKLPTIRLTDPFLERLVTEDENYIDVLCIRDEIIDNALDHCHISYIKIQSVKFLMDCLHSAYIDVINTAHMHYDNSVLDRKDLWKSDVQFQPLPLDNYAEFSMPFKYVKESLTNEEESETSPPTNGVQRISTPQLQESAIEESSSNAKTSFDLIGDAVSEYKIESFGESLMLVDEEELKASYATSTTELFEEITSEASFFTGVAEAEQNLLPPIETLRCENPAPKGSDAGAERITKLSTLEAKKPGNFVLPPLRLRARFRKNDGENDASRSSVKFDKIASMTDRNMFFGLKSNLKKNSNTKSGYDAKKKVGIYVDHNEGNRKSMDSSGDELDSKGNNTD